MNKIDFIYLKLCEKYGYNCIYLRRDIKTYYDTYPNKENVWEVNQTLGVNLGPIEFWANLGGTRLEKIDLKKEQEDGTFKD